ncbi:MAG: hypothetical protein HY066_04160 [Betaproteobacteria bacterium]|nr:hypothetical protein [Betaproteobacteria bacterium]
MRALPLFAINAIAMQALAVALWLLQVSNPAVIAHVAFALGILPLILAAMGYFAPVLTHSRNPPRLLAFIPPLAWLAGVSLIAGLSGVMPLATASQIAAGFGLTAAIAMTSWMAWRAKHALGPAHPGLAWYLAATGFLIIALLAVPAMDLWPTQRMALRLFHLHLNLLGFVGLTAIGTLQVLLPTAAGRADPTAAGRLSSDLWFACGGVLLIALGAALTATYIPVRWEKLLSLLGAALYMIAPLRMSTRWAAAYSEPIGRLHGAAASLALACFGLVGLLFAGIGHTLGFLAGRDAVAGFVVAFLLPLVSGAATQLLPVWLRPGPQLEWHTRLRARLGRLAGLRALLMVCGGLAISFGWLPGLWFAVVGVALLARTAIRALPDALRD